MDQCLDRLFNAAMILPEGDRVALIERLLETMPDREIGLAMDDPNLEAELDRRFADHEGEVSWADLRAEA